MKKMIPALLLLIISFQVLNAEEIPAISKEESAEPVKPGIVKFTEDPVVMEDVSDILIKYMIENRDIIRGIYLPGWKMVTRYRIDKAIDFCVKNNMNTIMVDLKNSHGEIFFKSGNKTALDIHAQAVTIDGNKRKIDFTYLSQKLKDHNIRFIGRYVMFRDKKLYTENPDLRLQENETWVDLRKDEVVDYNLALLNEAADLPVDEIALDYIRFPDSSDFGTLEFKLNTIESIVQRASDTVRSKNKLFSCYVSDDLSISFLSQIAEFRKSC